MEHLDVRLVLNTSLTGETWYEIDQISAYIYGTINEQYYV